MCSRGTGEAASKRERGCKRPEENRRRKAGGPSPFRKPQDARSDLFSLAVVLYEMVTGCRPFDADSLQGVCSRVLSSTPLPPSHANTSVPAGFDELIARCLAKDPAARYATAEALADQLYPLARRKTIPSSMPQAANGNGLRDRAARLLRSA